MASFTDAITQFNPYVAQLPVDAMVKVGMQKQAQYEEGYKKIQGEIDKVVGLDIMRNVDKEYLQSKVDELGTNLRTFAAGDFSNFQLVNSVGGMARQVGKDKDIQTAVASTAWARKQLAEMESAKKAGKSSVQNQWDFNEKLNTYTSSTDLGRNFNDSYTPYIDVNKKWMETLKALHPNLTEQDIPYELNPDGSLNYSKIAAAMQRVTKETVSADQIENAIRANLNPEDLNQLAINGRYDFRGAGVPQLQEYATKKYDANIKTVDDKIKTLEGYLNLTKSDPAEQDKVKKSIESLKASKLKLADGLKNELDFMSKNPEEAKAEIYKNGAILEFANAFSWETSKTQLLTNPVLEAQHWEKSHALDQSRFNLSVRSQNWTEYKDKHAMTLADKEYQLKVDKQLADLYGTNSGFHTYAGESTKVKDPVTAMRTDAADKQTAANNDFNYLLKNMPGTTAAMLEENLKEYANGNKSKIPINFRQNADDILANRNESLRITTAINRVETDLKNSKKFKDKEGDLYNLVKNLPGLNVTVDGVNHSFTQRELADYVSKLKYASQASPGGVGLASLQLSRPLTAKEQALHKLNAQSKNILDPGYFSPTSKNEKAVKDMIIKYQTAIGTSYDDYLKAFDEDRNKKLLEISGKYIPVVTSINVSNENGAMSRSTWENIAGVVLQRFDLKGGAKGGAEDLDVETAKGWLTGDGKKDIQYQKLVQGNTTYLVMMKGKDEVMIPLIDQEVTQLPKFKHEPSAFQQRVTAAQYMNNGNTNISNSPTHSIFPTSSFANVKNLGVTADLQWNDKNRSMNYINLNLKLPSGWKNLQLEVPVDADGALDFVNRADDKYIKSLYLNNSTVPSAWKDEIRNLK